MKHFKYTVVVWKEEEGYVSKCSELGVASCGDTVEEAVSNLKEAVALYLENAKELGIMQDIKGGITAKEKFTTDIEVTI